VNKDEVWVDIKEYEDLYMVSSAGRVKSKDREVRCFPNSTRVVRGRILKPFLNANTYLVVDLFKDNTRKRKYVHRLVVENFIGEIPIDKQVCHNNGDPLCNELHNLRIDTIASNMNDKWKHETMPYGEKVWNNKLTEKQVREILLSDKPHSHIAPLYGVTPEMISRIRLNQAWKHIKPNEVHWLDV